MSWLSPLVDALLDRLATKLAQNVRIELDAAIDAALDQAENRVQAILKDAEGRLLATVGQGAARKVVLLAGQQLEEAAEAAGMVPVSSVQAATKEAASDAAAVAATEIRAMLRRNTARRSGPSTEIPDR
jgi:hypothetical protein